jgi:WD40 repeat protein
MRPMFDLRALTFLPTNGSRELRTLSGDGYLRHIDLDRGVLEATPIHPSSIAAFSADGATWASSGGSWSQGYQLKIGRNARVTEIAREDAAVSLSVSGAGDRIAVADRQGARIVDPEGGLIAELSPRAGVITASPDGKLVAVAWSGYIDIYKKDGQALSTLDVSGPVTALAFSPDGQWIAAGTHSSKIELLRVADGSRAGGAEGHRGDCLALRFSDDGTTLFSSASDTTGLAWSVARLVAAGREN